MARQPQIDSFSGTTTYKEFTTRNCFIILMAFSIVLVWGGTSKCLGVLLPTLRDQFTSHTWLIGITLSLMQASSGIGGLFTILLEEKFGTRRLLIFSTLMSGIGLTLIPLATSVIHIAAILAFITGPSLGISSNLGKVVLGRNFSRHYALAAGINHSGQAVALLAFAPMMQLFLDTYGWRGAALLHAGVCMHPVVFAVLVREESHYQPLTDQSSHANDHHSNPGQTKFLVRFLKAADFQILLNFNFWILCSCKAGVALADSSWMMFYVPHLQAKGFSSQTSAALCSAAGVGYFFGTFLFAPFVDRGCLRCSTGIILGSLTLTLSLVFDPWVNGVVGMATLTFLYGLSISTLCTLTDVFTKELFGSDRLTSAFSWIAAIGVLSRVLGGFLPGWIYDTSGSYDLAFIIIGIVPTLALAPLIIGKRANAQNS